MPSAPLDHVARPALPAVPVEGRLVVGCERRGGVTIASTLFQKAPLRALFPMLDGGPALPVLLVNTSGGIVGGDRLSVSVTVGPGAAATVLGQAAEKAYRSAGAEAEVSTSLKVGAGGMLELLPQGTILFDGVRLVRSTLIEIAPDARLIAGEILVFGRRARGERLTHGWFADRWDLRIDGRLAWADRLRLAAGPDAMACPFGLDRAEATALAILAGPGVSGTIDAIRDDLEPVADGHCGATAFDRLVLVRWLGRDALALREAFGRFWAKTRARLAGLEPVLPSIWHR